MIGQHLHIYDRRLCAYAVDNVAQHMSMIFPPLPDEQTAQDTPAAHRIPKPRPSRFRRCVEKALASQPLLLGYLQRAQDYNPDVEVEEEKLLLNDVELRCLEEVFESDLNRRWEPNSQLNQRYLQTIKEVCDQLTCQAAEEWSEDCARFALELERDGLWLTEGLDIIGQWVRRLRTLLRVMGAVELLPAPEGRSPTPTHPTPAPPATNTQSTEPVDPTPPAAPVASTELIPGLAAVLSQLTDAVNGISASAATQPPPEALSKEDAAKFLGVSVKTVEYLIRVRKIQYVQLGSQRGRVIPVEALRKLLQDNVQLTAQEELHRRARR